MIISDITPLNTKKSKIIFLDGDSIALYNGEIRRMDITVGREISEEEYYITVYPILKKRAFARLLHILEKSFKSENDIIKKLRYINTYKNRYSKLKLKYKLMEKGINKEIIDNALESCSVDEIPMIKKLLNKKHYFETDETDKKQKIIASIMRQGFKYQKIKDVINDTSIGE